ncbi:F-box only protein 31-like [Myotis yumanensis]|uniref:F-box only protein 31-like n=1 Tax=Myotis yumanensis TaxID=159337 RepID=UPI0038D374F9
MEECACRCGLGSSRGCRCLQKCQGPAETAAAKCMRCRQECQGPAKKGAAKGKPGPAEKHLEVDTAAWCCGGSGGIASPMPRPHCSLQDLPVEMLVEIFASLLGTDLASLAQACTKFHYILHTESIWRQHCREEYGFRENLQNLDMIGMSYREVYAKIFPFRNILGLWQLDNSYGTLLNVVLYGFCITGWTFKSDHNTPVHGPMQFKPSFRIRLTERKSATVEYIDDIYSFSHSHHMQIQKDRVSIQYLVLVEEDSQVYGYCLTYSRVYLLPSHPDDLLRPGLFHGKYDNFGLMIAMLSFHGKYARVTKITGESMETLKIHLMRRIQLRDGEIFRNFKELSHVVQEIDKQVIREQQQQQQQMCFYGVHSGTDHSITYSRRFPGVFILFDENHFGFIGLEMEYFILFGRVQKTFQNVEAPSPQAFLEVLSNIQSRPSGRSTWGAL